ncbi:tRNA lysidine(34) synthetase TilS [Tessaracoccus sp.]
MARRELGPASLAVAQAVATLLPPGRVVLGCSGGADSLALALGARWAASRRDSDVRCVVVDHGLQAGSGAVAHHVVEVLRGEGLAAEVRQVHIDPCSPGGPEATARDARLSALSADGLPVLLGHTLDDQAETVLLGLLRGSGTRSLAGMATVRGPFLRPLLAVRRSTTVAACSEWGVEVWEDPHNDDPRYRRVRARRHLGTLGEALGQDVAPALARSAMLARVDADFLDELAAAAISGVDVSAPLEVNSVRDLPDALRLRVLRDWVSEGGQRRVEMQHILAVDQLITAWRGQGVVNVQGGHVERRGPTLHVTASDTGGPSAPRRRNA